MSKNSIGFNYCCLLYLILDIFGGGIIACSPIMGAENCKCLMPIVAWKRCDDVLDCFIRESNTIIVRIYVTVKALYLSRYVR